MSITVTYEFGNSVPRIVRIATTDLIATVTTAGWLNKTISEGAIISPNDLLLISYGIGTGSQGVNLFSISFAAGVWTVTIEDGQVVLPVISGNFANFSGTSGAIADLGYLPSDAAKTKVVMAGSAVVVGHMALFTDTAGTIDDTAATAINNGNIQAGLSGTAGTISSFPGTAANGSLILSALNAGGAFNTTIRNSAMGQSTVYSLGDIGAATGGIPVSTAPLLMKSVAGAAAAGGAAAQSFTDAFCTTGSNVIGNWNTQANAASVLKIVPGNGSFVVTSSADAGVATFSYIITK